jgi:hypothetical protein
MGRRQIHNAHIEAGFGVRLGLRNGNSGIVDIGEQVR